MTDFFPQQIHRPQQTLAKVQPRLQARFAPSRAIVGLAPVAGSVFQPETLTTQGSPLVQSQTPMVTAQEAAAPNESDIDMEANRLEEWRQWRSLLHGSPSLPSPAPVSPTNQSPVAPSMDERRDWNHENSNLSHSGTFKADNAALQPNQNPGEISSSAPAQPLLQPSSETSPEEPSLPLIQPIVPPLQQIQSLTGADDLTPDSPQRQSEPLLPMPTSNSSNTLPADGSIFSETESHLTQSNQSLEQPFPQTPPSGKEIPAENQQIRLLSRVFPSPLASSEPASGNMVLPSSGQLPSTSTPPRLQSPSPAPGQVMDSPISQAALDNAEDTQVVSWGGTSSSQGLSNTSPSPSLQPLEADWVPANVGTSAPSIPPFPSAPEPVPKQVEKITAKKNLEPSALQSSVAPLPQSVILPQGSTTSPLSDRLGQQPSSGLPQLAKDTSISPLSRTDTSSINPMARNQTTSDIPPLGSRLNATTISNKLRDTGPQPSEPPPTIEISIGRIEVRAQVATSNATTAKKQKRPRGPKVSLSAYLQQRNGAL